MATLTPSDRLAPGTHNCVIEPRLKNDIAADNDGKYGRLFPDLPPPTADDEALLALGRSGAVMDDASGRDRDVADNPCIPAGWTFFGQFIAHDITADRSLLQHHANLDEIRNFRTPQLNLELVYAAGPTAMPYLYDGDDPDKLLLGRNDQGLPNDLPRNWQGRALVGDPRQDVHVMMSQLQLAVLMFHNRIVDWLREQGDTPPESVFARAQQLARRHYQWITVHEFLPLSVGQALVDDILADGPRFYVPGARPFIPVEFADAAYRFGHSQIRAVYQLNDGARGSVFPDCAGARPVPQARAIDWRYFFDLDPAQPPQQTRRIDARLVHSLIDLPPAVVGETPIPEYHSLAVRDLQRGRALDLPSGEAVARLMGITPLTGDELGLRALGWEGETPLWYYVLKESELRTGGERLGPVGGRIVAEVLLGLIDADPTSYRNAGVTWTPILPARQEGRFTMADLLRFARASGSV